MSRDRPRPVTKMPEIEPSDHELAKSILRKKLVRYCERLLESVERGERHAMNIYPRIMGLIGAENEIAVTLIMTKELNCGSLEEARRKIRAFDEAVATDEDSSIAVMEQSVREWYARRGKRILIVNDYPAAGEPIEVLNGPANSDSGRAQNGQDHTRQLPA